MSTKSKKLIAIALAMVLSVVLIWEEVLEDRVVPKRWGIVEEESIYRSGQLHEALVERTLKNNEIDVVINMNKWRLDKPAQAAEETAVEVLGIESARYPMGGDGTGDPAHYVLAVEHLHRSSEAGQRVLVHCTAGSQRTGAVIALYRTLIQGWSVDEVLDEMEIYDFDRKDDTILLDFLDTHIDDIATQLAARGVLEAVPDPLPKFNS